MIYIDTELVLPMCNTHPYFSLKNLGKNVRIIHGKKWYIMYFCQYFSLQFTILNLFIMEKLLKVQK